MKKVLASLAVGLLLATTLVACGTIGSSPKVFTSDDVAPGTIVVDGIKIKMVKFSADAPKFNKYLKADSGKFGDYLDCGVSVTRNMRSVMNVRTGIRVAASIEKEMAKLSWLKRGNVDSVSYRMRNSMPDNQGWEEISTNADLVGALGRNDVAFQFDCKTGKYPVAHDDYSCGSVYIDGKRHPVEFLRLRNLRNWSTTIYFATPVKGTCQ